VFGLLVHALLAWFVFRARAWQLEGHLLPTHQCQELFCHYSGWKSVQN